MNLIKYLYRQSSFMLLIAGLFAVISGLGGAALIAVITEGIKGGPGGVDFAARFFGLCVLVLLTRSASQIALVQLTQKAVLAMRVNLSKKMLTCSYKQLQQVGKPGLLVILTQDIEGFIGALQIAPRILTDAIVIIACFAYLGWLSWVLFAMLAVTLVISLVLFNMAQRRPLRKMRLIRAKWEVLYKHFRDLVEGSRELQLNKQRGHLFVDEILAPDAKEFKTASMQAFTSFTLISNVGDMLFYIAIGVLLFVVPVWLPQTPAVLTGVTMILLYLVGPISNMINSVPALGHAAISLEKIQQLDNKLSEEAPHISGPNPFDRAGATLIEFEGVCHHYPGKTDDNPFLLGPLDLQVRKGEVLFIVGGNGSGKTTLAMLLLGLYLPESGLVRMNGEVLTELNVERYREHFGAVFADFHLFEHLLGTDQKHIEEMATQYIEKLSLDHKVKVVDGKFSTIDLSSGQKKRLALITAYLEDKDVYLFDEWAADQDPTFKRVFYTELLPDLKARQDGHRHQPRRRLLRQRRPHHQAGRRPGAAIRCRAHQTDAPAFAHRLTLAAQDDRGEYGAGVEQVELGRARQPQRQARAERVHAAEVKQATRTIDRGQFNGVEVEEGFDFAEGGFEEAFLGRKHKRLQAGLSQVPGAGAHAFGFGRRNDHWRHRRVSVGRDDGLDIDPDADHVCLRTSNRGRILAVVRDAAYHAGRPQRLALRSYGNFTMSQAMRLQCRLRTDAAGEEFRLAFVHAALHLRRAGKPMLREQGRRQHGRRELPKKD